MLQKTTILKKLKKILIISLIILFILQLILGSLAYYCIFNTKIDWEKFSQKFSYLASFVSNPNTPVKKESDKNNYLKHKEIEEILKTQFKKADNRSQGIISWAVNVKNNVEQVKIKSFDNYTLNGNILLNNSVKENKNWVILAFGYGDNGYDLFNFQFVKIFYDLGFNILMIDQRGYGLSEGKYTSLGYKERLDIKEWINFLVDRHPDCQIATWGVSMGAVSVLLACGEDLPSNLKLCIADCPFDSIYDLFKYLSGHMIGLPSFLSTYILNGMCIIARVIHGTSLNFSVENHLKKAKVPILFFHGDEDTFVPYKSSKNMYTSYKNYKKIVIAKYAPHCLSVILIYDKYIKHIKDFTRKFMDFNEFDNLQNNNSNVTQEKH